MRNSGDYMGKQERAKARLNKDAGNKFGTFGGVFTPSILTIFGVIMFMRANFVIGEAGIFYTLLILLAAKAITFLTSLSIAAIATNMQVRGGGAYFMISRVLGAEFGGAIGLALFFAQALSVPFYLLGFTEALVRAFPGLTSHFSIIALISAGFLFFVAYVGAEWAIKTQFVIMAVLFSAIVVFMLGAWNNFSMETLNANWSAAYTNTSDGSPYSFWIVFAIFFPAVTGILAGINMSGDLKDPAKSIPVGTLYAIGVGAFVYFLQIVICGGAFARADLIEKPYQTLVSNAFLGAGFLVAAGVYAATLSSALGSFLGAPRILQAVARDGIVERLKPFGVGAPKTDEPRRALILTGIITVAVILWAGNETGGGALNIVAAIITMFFLYTYGMVNLAAFIEAYGANPSFRPRFRWFHWLAALVGAAGCVGAAFLIDSKAALGAVVLLWLLLRYVRNRKLKSSFGDARRGFFFTAVRDNLLRLRNMEEDSRNWRPTILVFSGNPQSRETLVSYAVWLESGRGIVILANILLGKIEELCRKREAAVKQLKMFCVEKNIQAFPQVVVAPEVSTGVSMFIQGSSLAPIRPNLTMFGWVTDLKLVHNFLSYLREADLMKMGQVLIKDGGLPDPKKKKRIDLWWRGRKNGSLMMVLAHLLIENWEWSRSKVRVLRVIENEAGKQPALEAMEELIHAARVEATAETIVSDEAFVKVLHQNSSDADCVFLGFDIPEVEHEEAWFNAFNSMVADLPTTILVHSYTEEGLLE